MSNVYCNPLSKSTWNDFEKLFGAKGACGGCWCMYWRLTHKDFEKNKGNGNKKIMKELVSGGEQLGLIMYIDDEPIGWCAFAPREEYVRLETSRVLKPVDDEKVWSIVCFFIKTKYRRKGYTVELIKNVIEYCKQKNVKIIESYPVEPSKEKIGDVFAWVGIASAFAKAGFKEVARRSETRPMMRYYL
ncbi:MAG: GNAT family N-acetyltransferase [bacterium]